MSGECPESVPSSCIGRTPDGLTNFALDVVWDSLADVPKQGVWAPLSGSPFFLGGAAGRLGRQAPRVPDAHLLFCMVFPLWPLCSCSEPEVHSVRRRVLAGAFSRKHIDVVGLQGTRTRNPIIRVRGGFHMATSAAVSGRQAVAEGGSDRDVLRRLVEVLSTLFFRQSGRAEGTNLPPPSSKLILSLARSPW